MLFVRRKIVRSHHCAEKDAEISELRAANEEFQQRFTKLESLVSRLTTENN